MSFHTASTESCCNVSPLRDAVLANMWRDMAPQTKKPTTTTKTKKTASKAPQRKSDKPPKIKLSDSVLMMLAEAERRSGMTRRQATVLGSQSLAVASRFSGGA